MHSVTNATKQKIDELKDALGERLAVVAHHYQSDLVIRHADLRGDSLELARRVESIASEFIVFCGVHFMAESAAILARPGQKVYLPAPDADCVMAKMVPADLLDTVLSKLSAQGTPVLPLAYVNTSAAVKAIVGKHGGAVCTSANAERMLRWALAQKEHVLFLPDQNLGNNTADQIGLPESARLTLDVRGQGSKLPTVTPDKKLLLWPGLCAIHARFKADDIRQLRSAHPGLKIIVHPECAPAIVRAADEAGSTSRIIRYVEEAPKGSVIAVGTEINLVRRLANEHAGRVRVLPLKVSLCSDMAKTTPETLLKCLTGLAAAPGSGVPVPRPISVDPDLTQHARAALARMLKACAD